MKLSLLLLTLLTIAGPCCAKAVADGGQVRASEVRGEFQVTVFTSPIPLRAGPIDVSVLVQRVGSGEAVSNAVTVEITSADPKQPPLRAAATSEAATNKLLSAALFNLPAAGSWDVHVETTPPGNSPIGVSFTMDAAPPLPAWLRVWPWFGWPFAVILLFIVHRARVTSRQTHCRRIRALRGMARVQSIRI